MLFHHTQCELSSSFGLSRCWSSGQRTIREEEPQSSHRIEKLLGTASIRLRILKFSRKLV
ncbi:unnamed protein product, partial [Ceratitis capitata]